MKKPMKKVESYINNFKAFNISNSVSKSVYLVAREVINEMASDISNVVKVTKSSSPEIYIVRIVEEYEKRWRLFVRGILIFCDEKESKLLSNIKIIDIVAAFDLKYADSIKHIFSLVYGDKNESNNKDGNNREEVHLPAK